MPFFHWPWQLFPWLLVTSGSMSEVISCHVICALGPLKMYFIIMCSSTTDKLQSSLSMVLCVRIRFVQRSGTQGLCSEVLYGDDEVSVLM